MPSNRLRVSRQSSAAKNSKAAVTEDKAGKQSQMQLVKDDEVKQAILVEGSTDQVMLEPAIETLMKVKSAESSKSANNGKGEAKQS